MSWWDLGEGKGYDGADLALYQITCAFCEERGNFALEHHTEKKKPNANKKLNFDTYKCGNCGAYVMVLWSAREFGGSRTLHDFQVLPWPRRLASAPSYWPKDVGRYWVQAKRSLSDENWDAAAVMARSSMQLALRDKGADGANLKGEIDDLASKGILPPIVKDWSHEVRELGNDSAHPAPEQQATDPDAARDIVEFLDYLLQYLYTLPHRIDQYRKRQSES